MNIKERIKKLIIMIIITTLVGTSAQTHVNADNLIQPLGANVAYGKTVTAPDATTNTPKIVDSNVKQGWQATKNVPNENDKRYDPQEWVIDLENSYVIDKINLYWQNACAAKFNIYVSETNSTNINDWKLVVKEEAGTSGEHTYRFDATKARYVKLDLQYRSIDYGYYLYEIEVFTVGSTELATVENLALNATATASAHDGNNVPSRAIDGKYDTYWQAPMYEKDADGNILKDENGSNIKLSQEELNTPNITLSWEKEINFNAIQLDWGNGYLKGYKLQISEDGNKWEDIYTVEDGTASDSRKITLDKSITSKYLRMQGVTLGAYRAELRELYVYDESNIPVDKIYISNDKLLFNLDGENSPNFNLSVNVNPSNATNKNVTWHSENEEIAIVDENGYVTGIKTGKTTIVATSVSNPEVKVECQVIVARAIEKSVVTATKLDDSKDIKITWTKVDNAAKYELYRVTTEYVESEYGEANLIEKKTKIYEGIEFSYVDKELSHGEYAYKVKAIADSGNELICDSESEDIDPVIIPLDVTGVDIVKDEIEIYIGDSEKVKVNFLPAEATNKNIIWTSSNENVVTVDNIGMISAVAEGTAIITATTVDGGYTDTCVVKTLPVDVTSVVLNKTKATVEINNTVELYASILPMNATYKDVSWSSSDNKVAKVDANGIVTAKAAGTAIITATAASGTKAQCEINVRVSPKTIKISEENLTISPGERYTLIATITPADATEKDIIWSTDNRDVAWVMEDGTVIGIKEGTAIISAITVNGGLVATSTVTVQKKEVITTSKTEEDTTTVESTTVDNTTTKNNLITPNKAKIKKISKKKIASNKIKLSIKKVKGAVGYQVKVLKSKKAKKAIVTKNVNGIKVTIKSKKIKNKKKLFVKVRAYVLDSNNKKIFGKWSNAKSVKIKR